MGDNLKFAGVNSISFHKRFKKDADCLEYLSLLKWEDGYKCRRCTNNIFCTGKKLFNKRCTKCSYIHLSEGFAYLSLITDAYSRKIVGFYLSKDLSAQGSLKALKMALANNPNRTGLIHHSDRGVQYCCDEYVKLLQDKKIKISMTENGDPLENAIAERVNGILKQELLEEVFQNFDVAQKDVAIACSTYNHLRPHGSIDNLKPAEAHEQSGELTKRWKNYWKIKKEREVSMV